MSQENVELVRRSVAALAVGDWQGIFDTWDPQIEWHFEREAVISGVHRGRDQVRAALSSFVTEWEDFTVEIEKLIEADDERVVLFAHLTGRGRGSGLPLDFREANIFTIREGRIVTVKEFFDREQALQAAGLREYPMSQENVEVAVKQFEGATARDFVGVMDTWADDVTLTLHWEANPLSGTVATKAAVGEWHWAESGTGSG
jgi:ketosteroid isomerase-like protein